jgi:probable O-glycosylation ligase (exosortase A-associated)
VPLRDIVVVSIVVILAIIALRRPWIGVMNWTWLSIMNPHRYTWGFAYDAPVAAIAGASTLAGLLFTRDRRSPFQGAPTVWLFIFCIWLTLSWLLGYDFKGDYEQWDKVMKIYLMTFVALSLIHTRLQIMVFTWVTIGSLTFLAAKGGLFTILTGGAHRVWGPAGSFIADNNHFALATIVALPMLHFLQLQLEKPWQRHVMTLLMILCAAAALGSHSRGAFLALGAMAGVFWLRSPRKGPIGFLLLLVLLLLLPMMPQEWWERMYSIRDYAEDESAIGRLNGWLVAIEVAKHNFFGGGMSYQHQVFFDMYGVYNTNVIAAHSIYFQILGNHGFIGLFIYLGIWISTYRYAGKLRRLATPGTPTQWVGQLGAMVQASLVGFAVGGAFLSMPYFDLPYNLMVIVVLTHAWVLRQGWQTDSHESLKNLFAIGTCPPESRIRGRRRVGTEEARRPS